MSKSWLRKLFTKRSEVPARGPARSRRLSCETLEDRTLMAVAVWDGEGGLLMVPNYNWSLALNWVGDIPPAPGDDVVFPVLAAGAQKPAPTVSNNVMTFNPNVIVDGNYLVNNLSILDGGYRIDSRTPTAAPPGNTPPVSLTIQGEIFSSIQVPLGTLQGLTLVGPLTVNQAPNGTFTGNAFTTGQSNMTLILTNSGQSVNAAAGPGVLEISAPITQPAGVTVGLTKRGGGRVALSGNSSFGGTVNILEGQLDAIGPNALGLVGASNGTFVQDGAVLGFGGGNIGESLQIAGNGLNPVVTGGALVGGTGAISGVGRPLNTFAGGPGIAGLLVAADATFGPANPIVTGLTPIGNTWSGAVALAPSAAIGGGTFTISGQITGAGNLTTIMAPASTLFLGAANNFAGEVRVNTGTLGITNNAALAAGSFTTVRNGAALNLVATGLVVPEALFLNGNGPPPILDNNSNPLGALRLGAGAGAASTYSGAVTLLSDSSIGAGLNQTLTITGLFDDQTQANLRKVDQGTLVFPNANPDFTGNVNLENGRLLVRNPLALGAPTASGGGGITVTSRQAPLGTVSGTLQIQAQSAAPFTFSKALTLNGPGFNSNGSLNIFDVVTGTTGSNVIIDAGVSVGSATSFDVAPLSSLRVSGVIDSPGPNAQAAALTRTGTGALTLAGQNTYLGQTNLTAGLNIIETSAALGGAGGQGTVVSAGATLRFANPLAVTENLTLSGVGVVVGGVNQGALQVPTGTSSVTGLITLQGVTSSEANVNVAAGGNLTFDGVVSGNADLRKIGTGTLRLTGADRNTYVGSTLVSAGVLALAKAPGVAAMAGPITVGDGLGGNNADVLLLEQPNQIPLTLPGGNPLVVNVIESGLLNLNNNNTTVGGLNLQGGEVQTGTGVLTLNSDVTAVTSGEQSIVNGVLSLGGANRTFTVQDGAQAVDLLVNAQVTGGSGSGLTKLGGGAMTLANGTNNYAGPTTVTNGILTLGTNNALPATTATTVTVGGTLNVNGRTNTIGSLTGNGIVTVNGGTLTVGSDGTSTTFSGTLSDGATAGGGLTKVGTGTLILSGNSTAYTGTTNVTAGTVQVSANFSNSAFNVATGATLSGTGSTRALSVATGATLAPGAGGTGILTATNGATLASGSTFSVDIFGTTPGTQADQLVVTGSASLNNAILSVNLGTFNPSPGDVYTLVTASGGVSGPLRTVGGQVLTEGSTFIQNGRAFTISYLGNGGRNVTLAVSRAATVAVGSSANPSAPGQSITLNATLTPVLSTDPPPTGTVEFRSGSPTGTLLGTGTLVAQPSGSSVATSAAISSLALGNTTIFAVYTSTNQFNVQPASFVQSVSLASNTTLTPQTPAPVLVGDSASFLAAVAPVSGQPLPTGTFTFVNVTTGQTLGTAPLDSTGRATFTTTALPPGSNTVRVNYSGDANYRPSTATAVQVVGRQTRLVTGADAGPIATVQVFDPRTRALLGTIQPFDEYRGGVKVATGDVTGDGVDDIVVGAGPGVTGGHTKVFDGRTFAEVASFFSFPGSEVGSSGFLGGVNVAVADVNGDGRGDVIVGTAVANDHVKVFSGTNLNQGQEILSFFAFSASGGNTVGVTVAAGDVNGDGRTDIIVGSATFAGHVKVFDSASGAELISRFTFGQGYLGGINVAAGDVDGDGVAELIVGATNVAHVKALDARTGVEKASFFPFQDGQGGGAPFGVRVGAVDWDNDGLADIITGAGAGTPDVRVFDGLSLSLLDNFIARVATAPTATAGVFVGGSTNPRN